MPIHNSRNKDNIGQLPDKKIILQEVHRKHYTNTQQKDLYNIYKIIFLIPFGAKCPIKQFAAKNFK